MTSPTPPYGTQGSEDVNEFARKAWNLADVFAEAAMQKGYGGDDSPFKTKHEEQFHAAREALRDYLESASEVWQASRLAALEEAAKACEEIRSDGDTFKPFEDNHDDGHIDGCNNCASAIRALATPADKRPAAPKE